MNLQNPKFVLVAIALLFIAPLLLAILMRSSWWDYEPAAYANRGQLVEPPIAFPIARLDLQYSTLGEQGKKHGNWVILYPFPGTCDDQCRQDITGFRQIHIAAGRNRSSIEIWLVSPLATSIETQKALVSIYPEFTVLTDSKGVAGPVLSSIRDPQPDGLDPWQGGQAFLLDPATNIILRYAPGYNLDDINQDLDRLLKWSGKD